MAHVYYVDEGPGLCARLAISSETLQPDYLFALTWDGYGFAAEQVGN